MNLIQKSAKSVVFGDNVTKNSADNTQNAPYFPHYKMGMPQDTFSKALDEKQKKLDKKEKFLTYFNVITTALLVGFIGFPIVSKLLKDRKINKEVMSRIDLGKINHPEYRAAIQDHLANGNMHAINQLLELDKISATKHGLVNIEEVTKKLNENIIGMDSVKAELRKLAVQMNHNVEHGIKSEAPLVICLAGPPGTGKTSVAKAFAEALGIPFHKIEMGGASGASKLRGVEGQYVNSCAGEVARAQVNNGTNRILYCLDEAEKVAKDTQHGDPHSALASLTDNSGKFGDDFLKASVDTSDSIVIMTVNDKNQLPEYIRNRAKIIDIPPYTQEVKAKIADIKLRQLLKNKKLEDLVQLDTSANNNVYEEIIRLVPNDEGGRQTVKALNESLLPAIELVLKGERANNSVFFNLRNSAQKIEVAKLSPDGKIIIDSDFVKRWLGPDSDNLWKDIVIN